MKYNKFVFLYTSNFCERINDFFCLDEWIENGYIVEYWDLSAITCHEHMEDYMIKGLTVKTIINKSDFENKVIDSLKDETLFLTWVNYSWYSASFYDILTKYHCPYAFFDNGIIPIFAEKKIVARKFTIDYFKVFLRDKYYLVRGKLFLHPASFYFKLSEYIDAGPDKMDDFTQQGWCNSGDYEKNRKLTNLRDNKFIVFLDQYIPYHNDFKINNVGEINAEDYFRSMNRCFQIIENIYQKPIVIAAHPAALNYKYNNPYDGREIVFNSTAQLVKSSCGVVMHATTAVSSAVMNKKPLMLVSNHIIKSVLPYIDYYMRNLSLYLNVNYYDIEHTNTFEFGEIDDEKYNIYLNTYLTNQHSSNITNFQSIISLLKES